MQDKVKTKSKNCKKKSFSTVKIIHNAITLQIVESNVIKLCNVKQDLI